MRKRLIGLSVALATMTALFGVGAGIAQAGPAKAMLNVVHGIPGLDVDVCVNGAKAITDFNPGEVVSGVALPEGTYRFRVVAEGDDCDDVVLKARRTLEGDRNYTVIANLNDEGEPNLKFFRNNTRKTEAGQARVIVRHTADAPAVNVWANGAPLNRGFEFTWGEARRYDVPKGDYTVFVSLPRQSDPVIGPVDLMLKAGYSYQVYAWGNGSAGYDLAVIGLEVGQKH